MAPTATGAATDRAAGRAARQPDGDEQRQRHLGRSRRARRPAAEPVSRGGVGVDEQEVVRAGEAAGGGRIEDERDRHAEEEGGWRIPAPPRRGPGAGPVARRDTARAACAAAAGARPAPTSAEREQERAALGLRQRVQREPGCGEQERASQRPRSPDGPGDECERCRALERDRPGGVAARRQIGALAHLCQARHDERDGSGDGERAADHDPIVASWVASRQQPGG